VRHNYHHSAPTRGTEMSGQERPSLHLWVVGFFHAWNDSAMKARSRIGWRSMRQARRIERSNSCPR